jgi:hypothetical protein
MSTSKDREWQFRITELLAKVETNQTNLHEKIDDHIKKSDARFDKLDKIVIGNGHKGLAEEVRSIKGKWGAAYSLAMLALNGLMMWVIHLLK